MSLGWLNGMQLRYVVITSVNRDDLPDGGSRHFAETVRCVREALAAGSGGSADRRISAATTTLSAGSSTPARTC